MDQRSRSILRQEILSQHKEFTRLILLGRLPTEEQRENWLLAHPAYGTYVRWAGSSYPDNSTADDDDFLTVEQLVTIYVEEQFRVAPAPPPLNAGMWRISPHSLSAPAPMVQPVQAASIPPVAATGSSNWLKRALPVVGVVLFLLVLGASELYSFVQRAIVVENKVQVAYVPAGMTFKPLYLYTNHGSNSTKYYVEVTNNSNVTLQELSVVIRLLDKNGKVVGSVPARVNNIAPGAMKQLSGTIQRTDDFARSDAGVAYHLWGR